MCDYDRMVVAGCLVEDGSTFTVRQLAGLGARSTIPVSGRAGSDPSQ
jgi:hypothetical protein